MFGIEKDFQQLMEQVYGPHYGLGRKVEEESARISKQLVDNAVKEVKMTEQKQQPPEIIEIGGVKYQRVEESQEPKTLEQMLNEKKYFLTDVNICDIVEEWMSQYTCDSYVACREYLNGYDACLETLKSSLR